eukprot:scaffold40008_cov69-Cyclotella_meneghiniana.AAC.2
MNCKEDSTKRSTPNVDIGEVNRHSKSPRAAISHRSPHRTPLSRLSATQHNSGYHSTKRNLLKDGSLSPLNQKSPNNNHNEKAETKFYATREAELLIINFLLKSAFGVIPQELMNPLSQIYQKKAHLKRHPDDCWQGGRGLLNNLMGREGVRFFTLIDETEQHSVTFAMRDFMYVYMPKPINGATKVNDGNMTHMVDQAEGSIVGFHFDEIFGHGQKTSKVDGMPMIKVAQASSSPDVTIEKQIEQTSIYLAPNFVQSSAYLRRLVGMGLKIGQLPAPTIKDNRDSMNRLIRDQKLLLNHYPRTRNCRIGKADTAGPGLGPITAKKLETEQIYVNAFAKIAEIFPGGLINGHYVVHYSKDYEGVKKVVWDKPHPLPKAD